MKRRLPAVLIILGCAGVSLVALPWTRDMIATPAVEPHTQPRPAPPGVVAVDGERLWDRGEADEKLQNPLEPTDAVLAEGEALYGIYCAVCHGATGAGDGPLAGYFIIMPSLALPAIQAYSDGWLYSVVREGGFMMPGHAEALNPSERWAVIHYMRSFKQP